MNLHEIRVLPKALLKTPIPYQKSLATTFGNSKSETHSTYM